MVLHLRAQGLEEGDEHPALLVVNFTFTFYQSDCLLLQLFKLSVLISTSKVAIFINIYPIVSLLVLHDVGKKGPTPPLNWNFSRTTCRFITQQ